MGRAKWGRVHQAGVASPGQANNARWRLMRRSELVTGPSFSPQPAAGRPTWAYIGVSVSAMQSDTTTNGHAASASRTAPALGRLTAGLVAMIHSALIFPRPTSLNMSTAFRPGFAAMAGALQKRRTRSTLSGAKSKIGRAQV